MTENLILINNDYPLKDYDRIIASITTRMYACTARMDYYRIKINYQYNQLTNEELSDIQSKHDKAQELFEKLTNILQDYLNARE